MLKTIWNWFVISSASPEKTSLTIKGLLVGAIPAIMMVLPLLGLNIELGQLQGFVDELTQAIQLMFVIASGMMTLYGLVRKLFYTATSLKK